MSEYNNIKELADKFFELESKYDLINYKIDGIKVWQIIRWNIFSIIASKIFGLNEAHITTNKVHKIKQIPLMMYNAIFNTALFSKHHDVLVFPHDRVRLVGKEYIDINTKYFVDDLIRENKDILVLEKPYAQKHYSVKNGYTKYLDDSILYVSLFKKFIKVDFQSHNDFLNLLDDDIKLLFNIDLNLNFMIKESIQKYKSYYKYYYKLLNRIKPKQIYLVISYAYPWLVSAAKDLNIEVVELQHGAFSKYHLGYSYHKKSKVSYFPDKFLLWNDFWKNMMELPISNNHIEIYPFKFQENEIQKYKNIKKNKNQVIVLSQGTISNHMSKIILDNFEFFKDKVIKYKLHPGEIQRYKNYKYLMQLLEKENVELITDGNLYELLASSEYQVGVYSTAIYEGLEFGLKTILCDSLFVEYMDKLIALEKIEIILKENNVI